MNLYISKSDADSGKKVVLDDMILTTHLPTSAGSKMLDGYKSLFEAEVVTKLKDAGFNPYAKANTGEFGLGLLGETSFYGACAEDGKLKNAAAEIVKSGEADAAVVLEVNGTYTRAAALENLVFVKPTYGTVSRYGTIPAVCSGEAVSVVSKTAEGCRKILCTISGHDDKDGTSLPEDKCALLKCDADRCEIKKIALVKSLYDTVDDETKAIIDAFKNDAGVEVVEIDATELLNAKPAWNVLMSAELCNNVSRYDGVKYGYRTKNYTNIDELYTNSRTEAFGYLTKSTILFGSETLSDDNYMKVYDKSLRMRRVLSECMNSLLGDYDALLLPACSKRAYSEAEVKENKYISYDESLYTAPAAITGLPVVVANGVQLVGKAFSENSLLDLAKKLEGEGK